MHAPLSFSARPFASRTRRRARFSKGNLFYFAFSSQITEKKIVSRTRSNHHVQEAVRATVVVVFEQSKQQ
jgi:hypothetical protein